MEEPVALAVGEITLEARLGWPAVPAAGVVLCHPHPLYGGDMENPVIVRAVEVCRAAGLATLRFSFRGIGKSGGIHEKGEGERHDVTAALDFLEDRLGRAQPLGVIGYSFGAWVGGQVACADARVGALALIAPPLAFYDFGFLAGRGVQLLVAGSRDPYCPRPAFEALASRIPGVVATVIQEAGHFFFGKLYPLGEAVAAWAHRFLGASPGNAVRTGRSG